MGNGTAFAQLGQFAQILNSFTVALATACEGRDPKCVIPSLENRGALLTEKLRSLLDELAAGNDSSKLATHADIRIRRMIDDKETIFVGFVRDDDEGGSVLGDTMLDRVREAGFVPLEDSGHLEGHRAEWADDPELAPYYVVTNERRPGDSRFVRFFVRGDREQYWSDLYSGFSRVGLVACRAAPARNA